MVGIKRTNATKSRRIRPPPRQNTQPGEIIYSSVRRVPRQRAANIGHPPLPKLHQIFPIHTPPGTPQQKIKIKSSPQKTITPKTIIATLGEKDDVSIESNTVLYNAVTSFARSFYRPQKIFLKPLQKCI